MSAAVSLEVAIRAKYCAIEERDTSPTDALPKSRDAIKESALTYRPGGFPVERCSSIVLDHSGVTEVASEEELGQLCPQAQELHLCANSISQCKDMLAILSALPRLSLLDLTKNPLDCASFSLPPPLQGISMHPRLQTLVLNGTSVTWSAIHLCLEKLPQLEELHLCKNGHSSVELPPDFQHQPLRKLHISGNSFSHWTAYEKLNKAFPRLQTLIATANPIADVPQLERGSFSELASLNLSDTLLSSWGAIENLSTLATLTDLSLLNLPLGAELELKARRFAAIARMPALVKLNKTVISSDEREDAERWLIRVFKDSPQQPAVYSSLVKKHGSVYQLADVDLSPKKTAKIDFYFEEGKDSEAHVIKVSQSTLQLKKWVSKRIGLPSSTFRLVYHDLESPQGAEVMSYERRPLYLYGLKEGDRIYVQMKPRVKHYST